MAESIHPDRLLVQIATYNTNLQGVLGTPQDLVDWLAPTLQVSSFLTKERRAPDIVAVGFQELLPLHLGRQYSEHTLRGCIDPRSSCLNTYNSIGFLCLSFGR
jgi:hypothetical protein